jgi:hypothetical protein
MIEEAESAEQKYAYLSYASFFPILLKYFRPYHIDVFVFVQKLKGESGNVEEEEIGAKGF